MREPILRECSAQSAGPYWIKSSLSYANAQCVEVASLPGGAVGMRDSKNVNGPMLQFTLSEWQAFIAGIRNGEFGQFG